MSEPIQSIAQNNYILQGTVATSAGIVGDGSTQNPLRADETVLWEGHGIPSYSVVLTEAANNFERLKIMVSPEADGSGYATFVEISPNDGRAWDLLAGNGDANAWLSIIRLKASNDYLTLTTDYKKSISFGAYTSTSTSLTATSTANPTCILKVIGINRKA